MDNTTTAPPDLTTPDRARQAAQARAGQQVKGLWRSSVLTDMRRSARSPGSGFTNDVIDQVDVYAVAQAAVEYVIDQAFTDHRGADRAEIVAVAQGVAAAMTDDADVAAALGEFVVGWLLNDPAGGTRQVSWADPAVGYATRTLDIALLRRIHSAVDGHPVVRAGDELVNMLLIAFETDLADAGVARDAVLKAQLTSGRLDAAGQTALDAARLTETYAETLRAMLDTTRRNVTATNWRSDGVPALLDRARAHLTDRIRDEADMITTARTIALEADDAGDAAAAMRVAHTIAGYRATHDALHTEVMAADDIFLDAQLAQSLGISLEQAPDLDEVLNDLLTSPADVAADLLDRTVAVAHGPVCPTQWTLLRLLDTLLAPRRDRTVEPPHLDPEQDLHEVVARQMHDPADVDRVENVLGRLDRPTLLSDLLQQADNAAQADLLAWQAVRDMADPTDERRAEPAGRPLATATHTGHDLLVIPTSPAGPANPTGPGRTSWPSGQEGR